MATIHIQCIRGKTLLSQNDLTWLIKLARQSEAITVLQQEDDVPTLGIMRLTEQGGAFDFWKEAGEDAYSAADGEPV